MDTAKLTELQEAAVTTLQSVSKGFHLWYDSLTPEQQKVVLVVGSVLGYCLFMWSVRVFEEREVVRPPKTKTFEEHGKDVARVLAQIKDFLATRKPGQAMSINRSRGGHSDSNRTIDAVYKRTATRIDVSLLDQVLGVDPVGKGGHPLMHMEPGVPMDEMARIALAHGYVPQVVMEFPGITVGGGISGGGIESSSHAYGCFFDTVEEVDMITGDGVYRTNVSRTNEPDLFASLGTTYGTVGVLTRVAVRLERASKYVKVRYLHCDGMESACNAMVGLSNCAQPPAFIDGVCLSEKSAMIVVGDYADDVTEDSPLRTLRQYRSDQWFFWLLTTISRSHQPLPFVKSNDGAGSVTKTGKELRAMACKTETILLEDYLFRFDRGAFWMARHGLKVFWGNAAYHDAPAPSAGPSWWIRVKYAWLGTTRQLYRMLHRIGDENLARHYVVQDYIMPSGKAACELVKYTAQESMGIWPLWLCPVRMVDDRHPCNPGFGFPVQETRKGGIMVNVGVYGMPNGGKPFDPVLTNKGLETEATRLEGRKMLYAQSFYSEKEFNDLFERKAYDAVRQKYGCVGVFPDANTKLLLGPERLAKLSGIKPVSFFQGNIIWGMLAWYSSLHWEAILPRFLHSAFWGIEHTGMTEYAPYSANAKSFLKPYQAEKELGAIGQGLGANTGGSAAEKEAAPVKGASTPGRRSSMAHTISSAAKRAPSTGKAVAAGSGRKRAGSTSRV